MAFFAAVRAPQLTVALHCLMTTLQAADALVVIEELNDLTGHTADEYPPDNFIEEARVHGADPPGRLPVPWTNLKDRSDQLNSFIRNSSLDEFSIPRFAQLLRTLVPPALCPCLHRR